LRRSDRAGYRKQVDGRPYQHPVRRAVVVDERSVLGFGFDPAGAIRQDGGVRRGGSHHCVCGPESRLVGWNDRSRHPLWHDERPSLECILASWGTVALAALAAGILLALVWGWGGNGARRVLRVLAWTGCVVMTTVGLIGTGEVVACAAGRFDMSVDEPGDLAPWVYGYVYGSFLVLGLSFGATACATRPSQAATRRPAMAETSR
jgi:hypothetical protein